MDGSAGAPYGFLYIITRLYGGSCVSALIGRTTHLTRVKCVPPSGIQYIMNKDICLLACLMLLEAGICNSVIG